MAFLVKCYLYWLLHVLPGTYFCVGNGLQLIWEMGRLIAYCPLLEKITCLPISMEQMLVTTVSRGREKLRFRKYYLVSCNPGKVHVYFTLDT